MRANQPMHSTWRRKELGYETSTGVLPACLHGEIWRCFTRVLAQWCPPALEPPGGRGGCRIAHLAVLNPPSQSWQWWRERPGWSSGCRPQSSAGSLSLGGKGCVTTASSLKKLSHAPCIAPDAPPASLIPSSTVLPAKHTAVAPTSCS